MNYYDYQGAKLPFAELPPQLRETALNSFVRINMDYLMQRPGSIHQRINRKFIRQRARSISLVRRIATDSRYADASFAANLTEFTSDGCYLNFFLEPPITNEAARVRFEAERAHGGF